MGVYIFFIVRTSLSCLNVFGDYKVFGKQKYFRPGENTSKFLKRGWLMLHRDSENTHSQTNLRGHERLI